MGDVRGNSFHVDRWDNSGRGVGVSDYSRARREVPHNGFLQQPGGSAVS